MSQQPQPIFSELRERVIALLAHDNRSELDILRIKIEIEKVASTDRFESNCLLGMIFTLLNQPDEMRRHFNIALRLRPNSIEVLHDFAVALNNLGFCSESEDYYQKTYEFNRGNLKILDDLITVKLNLLKFHETQNLFMERAKLNPDAPYPLEKHVKLGFEYFRENEISDHLAIQGTEAAHEILRTYNKPFITGSRQGFSLSEDEESQWMVVDFQVPVSVEMAVDMSVEFAEKIAANDEFMALGPKIAFLFTPINNLGEDDSHAA